MPSNGLNHEAGTWLTNLITACWQGGLLILAVWALTRLLRKMPPAIRQGLWWLACLKLLVTILWIRPVPIPIIPAASAPIKSVVSKFSVLANKSIIDQPVSKSANRPLPWSEVVIGIWLIGVLINLGVSTRAAASARRLVRQAKSIDEDPLGSELRGLAASIGMSTVPRLMESPQITAPCVTGYFKPVVLVPKGFQERLSADEQRMALAHELAHVRRGDLWLATVPSLCFSIFYFFPPVWLACKEWATDRESSCDFEALMATGARPKAYGEMLLKIAKGDHMRVIPGLGATAQFHTLRRRLSSMVEETNFTRPRLVGAASLAAACLFLVPWTLASPSVSNGTLKNAGMESGVSSPDGWSAQAPQQGFELTWDRGIAHSGDRSLRISRKEHRFWPIAQWSQEIPYRGDASSIQFGAWIKADHAWKAVLDVQFAHGDGKRSHTWVAFIGEQYPGRGYANHDWAQYSGVANIPPGTKRITVAFQDYGQGTVWMDDAFVQFFSNTPLR